MEKNKCQYYIKNCSHLKSLTLSSIIISIFYAYVPLIIIYNWTNYKFILNLVLSCTTVEVIRYYLISKFSISIITCTRNMYRFNNYKNQLNKIIDFGEKIDLISYNLINIIFGVIRYIPVIIVSILILFQRADSVKFLILVLMIILVIELLIYGYDKKFNKLSEKYLLTKNWVYSKLSNQGQLETVDTKKLQYLEKQIIFYSNLRGILVNGRSLFVLIFTLYEFLNNQNVIFLIYSIYFFYSVDKLYNILSNIRKVSALFLILE